MNLFRSCYFCLYSKEHNENMLCQNCINIFYDYKFYCCPRCSRFDCSGCEHLSEFTSIFCLYSYNSIISKIIVGAKDKFNINFQKIFEEIFYTNVRAELIEILAHKNYHAIILSPYNKTRLFHGYWHPNLFFEKILKQLKEKFEHKFKVLNLHYTTKKATNLYGNCLFPDLTTTDTHCTTNILLCDDVLTTGASALKCLNAVSKCTRKNENIKWDLFTIFRSPQRSQRVSHT